MSTSGETYTRMNEKDVRSVERVDGSEGEFEEEDDDMDEDDMDIQGRESFKMLANIALSDDDSAKLLHDTPSDTWGVILYIIVKDVGDLALGNITCAHIFRLVFGAAAMIVNLTMQVVLLIYTFQYVVTPAVVKIQRNYQAFHAICFENNGDFNQTKWENDFPHELKHNLCHAGMSQYMFLGSILFLWTLAMLQEFRENLRLDRHLKSIPNLPPGISHADQVVEREGGELQLFLVALSPLTRGLLYAFIVIPKYFIIAALTWIGLRWLSASESFSDLILNSLALQFIVTIDDVIFVSVFPEMMTERVNALKLAVPAPTYADDEEKEEQEAWAVIVAYCRSLLVLLVAVLILVLYIFKMQRVIPDYDDDLSVHCTAFIEMPLPCAGHGSMFGLTGRECFPYGSGSNLSAGDWDIGHGHGHRAGPHR